MGWYKWAHCVVFSGVTRSSVNSISVRSMGPFRPCKNFEHCSAVQLTASHKLCGHIVFQRLVFVCGVRVHACARVNANQSAGSVLSEKRVKFMLLKHKPCFVLPFLQILVVLCCAFRLIEQSINQLYKIDHVTIKIQRLRRLKSDEKSRTWKTKDQLFCD